MIFVEAGEIRFDYDETEYVADPRYVLLVEKDIDCSLAYDPRTEFYVANFDLFHGRSGKAFIRLICRCLNG